MVSKALELIDRIHRLEMFRILAVDVLGDDDENLAANVEMLKGDDRVTLSLLAETIMTNILHIVTDYAEDYVEDHYLLKDIRYHDFDIKTIKFGIASLDVIPDLTPCEIIKLDRTKLIKNVITDVENDPNRRYFPDVEEDDS
jgi:hypothetical protein